MDETKNQFVEKWMLDDGRRAEKRVTEVKNCEDGLSERVIELHVEDERPMLLQQRVKEKSKPFVFERTTETIDPKTGEVTDQKLETIDPQSKMQFFEHHVAAAPAVVAAQTVDANADECDCHVTKEEMIETIVAAIKAVRADVPPAPVHVSQPKKVKPARREKTSTESLSDRLNSLGLADEVEKRVDLSGYSTFDKSMLALIVGLIGVLGYVLFIMP